MIRTVVFDWAGTTVDYGCFAPVQAFVEVFKHYGVEPTMDETRKPMGMLKIDHIRTMLHMERIERQWRAVHGRAPEESDVQEMYPLFEEKLFSILHEFASPKPHVLDAVAELREMGVRIGSTTGYTQAMMDVVAPAAAAQGYAPDCMVTPISSAAKAGRIRTWYFAICRSLGRKARPRRPRWAIRSATSSKERRRACSQWASSREAPKRR